jgi:hypothetical protein
VGFNWRSHLAMQTQKVWNRLRLAPSKTTFSGHPELRNDPLGSRNALVRSLDPIGGMHQSQVQFRLGMQLQVLQWRKICLVGEVARYWQVNLIDRPLDTYSDRISDFHEHAAILRFLKMLMPTVHEFCAALGWKTC